MSKIRLPSELKTRELTKKLKAALAKCDRLNTLLTQKTDLLVAQQAKIDEMNRVIGR